MPISIRCRSSSKASTCILILDFSIDDDVLTLIFVIARLVESLNFRKASPAMGIPPILAISHRKDPFYIIINFFAFTPIPSTKLSLLIVHTVIAQIENISV